MPFLNNVKFFLKHSETGLQVKKWNFEKQLHWINCGPSSQKLRIMNSLKIPTWGNCAAKSGISSLTFRNFSGGFEAPPREIFRLPGWDVDGMMASQFKLSHYLFDSGTSTWRAGQWTAAIWKFVRYFETIETFLLTCAAHPKFGFASKFSELAVSTAPNASASKAWQPGTASFATLQKLDANVSVSDPSGIGNGLLSAESNQEFSCPLRFVTGVVLSNQNLIFYFWFCLQSQNKLCHAAPILFYFSFWYLKANFVLIKLKGFNLSFRRKLTQCN